MSEKLRRSRDEVLVVVALLQNMTFKSRFKCHFLEKTDL